MARVLEILKSKAFQAGLLLVVFCAALGSGLAYLVREQADRSQLVALESVIDTAREPMSARFALLEADVREAVQRVVRVTSEVMNDVDAPQADEVASDSPVGEASEAASTESEPVLPLEERWRIRLVASLGELLESRSDTLDITYLGRFSGVPSGGLMVARVERADDGTAEPTQDDPRPGWDGAFLQDVISHQQDTVVLSQPNFPTPETGPPIALVRGAVPVRGSDGSVVGVVLASIDLSETLAKVKAALPADTHVLLATAEGASLLHPVEELALAKGQSVEEMLASSFPELDWAVRNAAPADHYGHVGSQRAERLVRFAVGEGDQAITMTLALSAPIAPIDFAAVMGQLFGGGVLLALGGVLLVVGAIGAWWWRRRGAQEEAEEEEAPSELEARAEAIEAHDASAASEAGDDAFDGGDDAEDAQGDVPESTDDADAFDEPQAAEPSDAASEDDEPGDAADPTDASDDDAIAAARAGEGEPASSEAAPPPELDTARADAPEPEPNSSAEAPQPPPRTSQAGSDASPARELLDIRSHLEDELEAARQRALDELAAARERFEAELVVERERAIERLVAESRETLERELGEQVQSAVAERRPALEPCEFDLRQLLSEVAAWVEGESHGRGAQFGVRCSRQVPERLLGDPEWVGPLLVHLARSAMQCSDDAPVELNVSCSDEGPAAVKLRFEVVAPEVGLYADAAGHVREAGGAGASLAEELVDAMRGDLVLDRNENGRGCVRVELPMSLPH